MKKLFTLISVFILVAICVGVCLFITSKPNKRWEGLVSDYNYRDVGQSLNECLKKQNKSAFFKTGVLTRSNVLFSGWDCKNIGNPDVIYSLNFDPKENVIFYCSEKDGTLVEGKHADFGFRSDDIESLEKWSEPKFNSAICNIVSGVVEDIISGKRVHISCNAGRDRTGFFVAILAMAFSEIKQLDRKTMIKAMQCDYRKTKTLVRVKYNKIKDFFENFPAEDGMTEFLKNHCGIQKDLLLKASEKFIL